jgi:hypothetical protein
VGVYVEEGTLAIASDVVMAAELERQNSRSREAAQKIMDPLVEASLAKSDVPAQAAKAAVAGELAGSRIARYAPQDAAKVLGLSTTGLSSDVVLRAQQLADGNPNVWLIQTEAGQQLFRISSDDGLVDLLLSKWSIDYIAETLGLGNGSAARWDGAITEWWCNMVCEDPKNNRVIVAAMDEAGKHYLIEARPGAPLRGIAVTSTAIADDHNLGGVVVLPDGSLTYVYNQHNQANNLYAILGDPDGSIDSLARNPVVTIPGGGLISYNQLTLVEKNSTTTRAELYAATRRNTDTWGMIKVTYDLATRTITSGDYLGFFSSPDQQCYTHVGPSYKNSAGQQVVPCVVGYNPEAARRQNPDLYRFTINLETGEIRYANDSTVGQLGTARLFSEFTPAINRLAADWSRRLFYGARNVVLYAEGPIASPDDWTYYAAFFAADGTYTTKSFGRAGKRVGYRADSNYLPGMTLQWGQNGLVICLAREAYGTYTVEVWKLGRDGTWSSTTIYNSTIYPAMRPYWAGPMGWLFNEVTFYPNDAYIGAKANLRFVLEGTRR